MSTSIASSCSRRGGGCRTARPTCSCRAAGTTASSSPARGRLSDGTPRELASPCAEARVVSHEAIFGYPLQLAAAALGFPQPPARCLSTADKRVGRQRTGQSHWNINHLALASENERDLRWGRTKITSSVTGR